MFIIVIVIDFFIMGICQQYYWEEEEREETGRTREVKTGRELNHLEFTLTTESLTRFRSDCLVVYASHGNELQTSAAFRLLHHSTRRRLFEYLTIAEQELQKTRLYHSLIRMDIPSLHYRYLLFVRLQPWDGKSHQELERRLVRLTEGYLEVFQLKEMTNFTVLEVDGCLGVHYTVFFRAFMSAIKHYSKRFKRVNVVFHSNESMEYFREHIKDMNRGSGTRRTQIEGKKEHRDKKSSLKKDIGKMDEEVIY